MKYTLLGLLQFLAGFLATPVVMWQARTRRYSAWVLTPDDPFVRPLRDREERPEHFGWNEPTVRAFYAKHGRYWGDVYWLGWRNRAFGLAYRLKPEFLKSPDLTSYEPMRRAMSRTAGRVVTTYRYRPHHRLQAIDGHKPLTMRAVDVGLFGILIGPRIDNIWHSEPTRVVVHPNMDGRPALAFRSRKALKR